MPALSDRLLADIFIENLFFLIKSESGFYLYYYLLSVLSNGLQSSDREKTKKFKNIFPPQIREKFSSKIFSILRSWKSFLQRYFSSSDPGKVFLKDIFHPQTLLSICLTLSMMIRTCWSKDRTKLSVQLVSNLNNENEDDVMWCRCLETKKRGKWDFLA